MQEAVITAGAAHVREVALTVIVYRGRKAQLDQVGNRGEVAQHIERPHMWMIIRLRRNGNGAH